MQGENSVAFVDEGTRVLGQVIFAQEKPKIYQITSENPSGLEMLYNLDGKPKTDIKLFVGVYQVKETSPSYINQIIADNLNSSQEKVADLPLDVFNYQQAVKDNGISYVACRDHDVFQKFAADPSFSLVFINDRVAIFMVKNDFNQLGRQPSS